MNYVCEKGTFGDALIRKPYNKSVCEKLGNYKGKPFVTSEGWLWKTVWSSAAASERMDRWTREVGLWKTRDVEQAMR